MFICRDRVRVSSALGTSAIFAFIALFTCVNCALAQSRVEQKWAARVDGPAAGSDNAYAIATDSQGNVIVGGGICVAASSPGVCTQQELQIEKYSPAGVRLWGASLKTAGNAAWATAVATDVSGNVYVTGGGIFQPGLGTLITVKYSSVGLRQWIAYYKGPGAGSNTVLGSPQILVDSGGNSYISGFVNGPGFTGPITTIKYGPSGQQLWARQFSALSVGFANGSANSARGLSLDSGGNLYVTGSFDNNDPTQLFGEGITIKYSPSGARLWYKSTDNTGSGTFSDTFSNNGIVLDGAGNPCVVGTSYVQQSSSTATVDSVYVIKYTPNGVPMWTASKQGPTGVAIALDSHANAYVTGPQFPVTSNSNLANYSTSKISSSGAFEWTETYNNTGSGNNQSSALIVNGLGQVYVTGQSTSSGGLFDYATIKYETTGTRDWVIRYNGPKNGTNSSNGLPDEIAAWGGDLYVSGSNAGSSGQLGWATVDYVQDADVATPTSLAFTSQKIGTISAGQTITLTNSASSGNVQFEGIDVHGPFAESNNCPGLLAPHASCKVTVTYKPTAVGTQTGSVDVYDQWAGSPAIITLTGTGTN